jgi:hypothetical protein
MTKELNAVPTNTRLPRPLSHIFNCPTEATLRGYRPLAAYLDRVQVRVRFDWRQAMQMQMGRMPETHKTEEHVWLLLEMDNVSYVANATIGEPHPLGLDLRLPPLHRSAVPGHVRHHLLQLAARGARETNPGEC